MPFIQTDYEHHRHQPTIATTPIPVRACNVFPSLHTKSDGTNPLYNNYMFGAASGKKIKVSKKEKKRKNRASHHNQSVECVGRSYHNSKVNNQQQQSSQFLPDVMKTTKSQKSGSLVRNKKRRGEEICNSTGPYQTYEDTLSDEKNSQAVSGSEKESKEYQSQSSHSRKNQSFRKSNYTYGDRNIENLENLRNLCKAEKELRGIFQAVKQYEFPIIKDVEGNIKQFGKYQPQQKISKIPPIRPQNPIVFDKAFRVQQDTHDSHQNESINNTKREDRKQLQQDFQDTQYQNSQPCSNENYDDQNDRVGNTQNNKHWETSTIASSTFYSDSNKNQNNDNQLNYIPGDLSQFQLKPQSCNDLNEKDF